MNNTKKDIESLNSTKGKIPKLLHKLIRMDYGCFGYVEGYQRFKDNLHLIKISRYKAKWRNDAFNLGLKMGWNDAKNGKECAVYTYQPEDGKVPMPIEHEK